MTAEPSLPASVTADHTAGPTYRVLVVEDEEPVRRLLERQLKRWGHTVQLAVDGREALARITAAEAAGEPCQIVLSDLRMPGMSGEIFLENLRERGGGYENRIAFLTGDVSSRELERVVADGEIPILQKPYEPEKLRAIIELLGQAGNFSL